MLADIFGIEVDRRALSRQKLEPRPRNSSIDDCNRDSLAPGMFPGSGRSNLLDNITQRIAVGCIDIGRLHPSIGLVEVVALLIAAGKHAKLYVFEYFRPHCLEPGTHLVRGGGVHHVGLSIKELELRALNRLKSSALQDIDFLFVRFETNEDSIQGKSLNQKL